jgi:hypothetical protein
MKVCFCNCHSVGLSSCDKCWRYHPEPTTPQKIEYVYEGAEAQGEDVRTGPVVDPGMGGQTEEDLRKTLK